MKITTASCVFISITFRSSLSTSSLTPVCVPDRQSSRVKEPTAASHCLHRAAARGSASVPEAVHLQPAGCHTPQTGRHPTAIILQLTVYVSALYTPELHKNLCVCVDFLVTVVVEAALWEADLSGYKGHVLQQSAHLQLSHI